VAVLGGGGGGGGLYLIGGGVGLGGIVWGVFWRDGMVRWGVMGVGWRRGRG